MWLESMLHEEMFLKWPKYTLTTSGWGNIYGRRFYTTQTFVVSNYYQNPNKFDTMRLDCTIDWQGNHARILKHANTQ